MVGEDAPVKPTSLILDNLELKPYQYIERMNFDDTLSIRARVILSDAQYSDLGKIHGSVKVIRRGIDDKPREMELQEIAWSKRNGELKEEIWLSDKKETKSTPPIGWVGNLAFVVAEHDLILEELLNTLVSEGVTSEGKIKEIGDKITRERNWTKRREFNRLRLGTDLDEFLSVEKDK
jgi:hypothetical protein